MTYRTPIIIATATITVFTARGFIPPPLPVPVPTFTPTIGVSPVPTEIPAPTATPIPTRIPTPRPKPTPTPQPVPKYSAEQIYLMIEKYSREKSVDPNVIRHIAVCESGFNPGAKNHIYGGLFQFAPATWKSYRRMMGEDADPNLMFDAQEAIKTAVYLVAGGKTYLWPNCIP